jgi:hypothetical protein
MEYRKVFSGKDLIKTRHPDIPEKWDLAQAHMALPGSDYTIRQLWNAEAGVLWSTVQEGTRKSRIS